VAEEPVQDELELKPAEAGALFKAEMFATNLVLGYWKHMVAAVLLVLLGVLAYGQYTDWYKDQQRVASAQIASALGALPAPLPELTESLATGGTVDLAQVEKVGDDLVGIANGTKGTARVEALMTAAELYRMAEKADKQRQALLDASGDAKGVLAWSVQGALANLELEEGQGDAAVERLRKLAADSDGYLAEQATIDLGLALEHVGRKDEAAKVYGEFLVRFPDSKRGDQVKARQARTAAPSGASTPTETSG
jgi:hypothetical protein